MNIDEINNEQKETLASLREKIQAKREQEQQEKLEKEQGREVQKKELQEKVFVIEPRENHEFSPERYKHLAQQVNVLYHNSMVWKERYIETEKAWSDALKELSQTYEELLDEGNKPRFS